MAPLKFIGFRCWKYRKRQAKKNRKAKKKTLFQAKWPLIAIARSPKNQYNIKYLC